MFLSFLIIFFRCQWERAALEVSRTRHFGRARKAMFQIQAAINAPINVLEQRLGVQPFTRNKRKIQLTPEGNKLVARADMLIREWRKVRQESRR